MVRLKTRYLMVEVIWHQDVLENGTPRPDLATKWMFTWLEQKSREIIGPVTTLAYIKTLKIIYCNAITNTMIFRVNFEQYRNLWTVLTMITECCGFPTYFRVLHVAGSLKSVQKSMLKEYGKDLYIKTFDPIKAMNELYGKKDDIQQDEEQQQNTLGIEINITESDDENDIKLNDGDEYDENEDESMEDVNDKNNNKNNKNDSNNKNQNNKNQNNKDKNNNNNKPNQKQQQPQQQKPKQVKK